MRNAGPSAATLITGRILQGFLADMIASTRASIETLKDRMRRTTMRERILLGGWFWALPSMPLSPRLNGAQPRPTVTSTP